MSIKLYDRMRIAFMAAIILFAAGLIYAAESFSAATATDLDYFKGSWIVTMRNNPQASFHWMVKEDLQGGWLAGVVEQNEKKVSTDFWRRNGSRIERFAFTADGTFVKIAGGGWESNRLVLTGIASDKTGETEIRETITKLSDVKFQALWERNSGGKWIVFADEICTRQ
jgi:hypothetical protein